MRTRRHRHIALWGRHPVCQWERHPAARITGQRSPVNRPARKPAPPAFTVVELLVTVSILTVIVFALYQMFNQTQKALRGNITQVDVLETGRAAAEMICRDLEQIAASGLSGTTNLYIGLVGASPSVQLDIDERTPLRTNVLQEFYFLSRQTNRWLGTAYRVVADQNGVGRLLRFSVPTTSQRLASTNLSAVYFSMPLTNPVTRVLSTNFHRVADGIVHFKLSAVDPWGQRLGFETTNSHPFYRILRQNVPLPFPNPFNVVLRPELARYTRTVFLSNALPAYLELEMGILEPATFVEFQAIAEGSATAARAFLAKHANKVHLFRQRIPIRTAYQ